MSETVEIEAITPRLAVSKLNSARRLQEFIKTIMHEAITSLPHAHKLRTSNVRDKRDRRWFWTDNTLIEDYASVIGIYATGVYMVLCQRAYNQTQQSQVSGSIIADLLGIGRTTVTQALSVLEMHQLIDIEEQYDDETRQQLASIYTLLSVEDWQPEPTPEREKFVSARREAGIAKRTTPKDKAKRSAQRQKLAPEDTHNGKSGREMEEPRQGLPSENIPHPLLPKRRGYTVTRHTIYRESPYGLPRGGDKYNQYVEQDVKQDNNKQAKAKTEMSVDEESSLELDLAPSAQTPTIEPFQETLKNTLVQFAERRNVEASADELEALLEKWPAARLADDELAPALMGDYECFGLDKPAEAKFARAAAAKNPARLRWFMCAWLGFEEADDAYHERTKHKWSKTRCFFNKWEELEPPAAWLENALAELRQCAVRGAAEVRAQQAKASFEGLTARQKIRLNKETLDILNEDAGNEYFTQSSDEFFCERERLLLDNETLQWLTELENEDTSSTESLLFGEQSTAEPLISAPGKINLEIYIGPILAEIQKGLLELGDVDERRATLLEEDEWEAVKTAIAQRLSA